MGLGDVVDSFAAVIRDMEARHLPCAVDLYADVLEPRISAGDVCAGKPAIVACGRFPAAQVDIARYGVGSSCRLDYDWLGFRLCVLAKLSRFCAIGLGRSIKLITVYARTNYSAAGLRRQPRRARGPETSSSYGRRQKAIGLLLGNNPHFYTVAYSQVRTKSAAHEGGRRRAWTKCLSAGLF